MSVDLLRRLEANVQAKSLLSHPFYQAWSKGELTLDNLRDYACQYYYFESNLPTLLSAIHSRCSDPAVRQVVLSILWDEESGTRNHAALWMQFCVALSLSLEQVNSVQYNPQTVALVDTIRSISTDHSPLSGLAAIYAYEFQVPTVAEKKIEGLRDFYGIQSAEALEFFELHSGLDVQHAEAEGQVLASSVRPEDEAGIVIAHQSSLDAWWSFLDGVCEQSGIPLG